MADIFISYSSKDSADAERICSEIEKNGLTCWIAPRNIVPGSEWAAEIIKAISDARALLLIYSENSARSTQVPRELSIAENKGTFIIPYKIDNAELIGTFEYYLTSAHWITAEPEKNEYRINEICSIVSRMKKDSHKEDEADEVSSSSTPEPVAVAEAEPVAVAEHEPVAAAEPESAAVAEPEPVPMPEKKTEVLAVNVSSPQSDAKKSKVKIAAIAAAAVVIIAAVIGISTADGSKKITSDEYISEAQTDSIISEDNAEVRITKRDSYKITYNELGTIVLDYTGEWVGDKPEGIGSANWSEGNLSLTYTGDWKNGVFEGNGDLSMVKNGSKYNYSGEWKNGSADGMGKEEKTYDRGDITVRTYEGNYTNGEYNGSGELTIHYKAGKDYTYAGEFKNGKKEGFGKEEWFYSENYVIREKIYEGDFHEDDYNGNGTLTIRYDDGETKTYAGEFENGKKKD